MAAATVEIVDPRDPSTVLASTQTEDNGSYLATITTPEPFDGDFLKVIVRGGPGATMECDAAVQCGSSSALGGRMPIDEGVTMTAILEQENGFWNSGGVTIYSHLSAALAEDGDGLTSESLEQARKHVADVFGLTNNVDGTTGTFRVSNLTVDTNDDDARSALVAAGLLTAIMEDGDEFGPAFQTFTDRFVVNGGRLPLSSSNTAGAISLEDILDGAERVANLRPDEFRAPPGVIARLSGDTLRMRAASPEAMSAPRRQAGSRPPLDDAKAFVSDLQLAIRAVEQDPMLGDFDQFSARMEAAATRVEADADLVTRVFPSILQTINGAIVAQAQDTSISTHTETTDLGDVEAGIAIVSGATVVTIDQMIAGFDADITFQVRGAISVDESKDPLLEILATEFANVELSGTLAGNDLTVTIKEARFLVDGGPATMSEEEVDEAVETTTTFSVDRLRASLNVDFAETGGDGLLFDGTLRFSVLALDYTFQTIETGSLTLFDLDLPYDQALSSALSAGFAGRLTDGSDSIDLALAVEDTDRALTLRNTGETIETGSYVVVNNEIRVSDKRFNISYAPSSVDEFAEEFGDYLFASLGDSVFISDEPGETIILALSSSRDLTGSDTVLRHEVVYPGGDRLVVFSQRSTHHKVYRNLTSGQASAFPRFSEYSGVVPYVNALVSRYRNLIARCVEDKLVVHPVESYEPSGGVILGTVVDDYFPCGTNEGRSLTENAMASLVLGTDSDVRPVIRSGAELGVYASLSKAITGLDAVDPSLSLSAFGQVTSSRGEVTVRPIFILRFAGRRFRSDQNLLNFFDTEGAAETSITNQDGVTLTIVRSGTGEYSGTLSIGADEYGTISEGAGAIPIVTFTDGSFVSLY